MVDGGLSIGFHTNELDSEEKVAVMDMHNEAGWLLFQPNEIAEADVPDKQAELETKTPSQRLRAVLFVYWKQTTPEETFEVFYCRKMEAIIDSVKGRLDQ